MAILPRYNNCNGGYLDSTCSGYSNWDVYGRWVVVAAVIAGGFFIFFIFAFITARRRRRSGMTPYRGTGWAGGRTPAGHAPAQYTGAQPYYAGNPQYNNAAQGAAPPVYSPPPNQTYYGNGQGNGQGNPGYFGGQESGIELQQPQSAYQPQRGGDPVYAPPMGPPPGKGDGIIR